MMIKVDIIQKQTIKPSRPTPHNLKDYKFSLLDQLAVKFYVPVVLFYPPPTTGAGIFHAGSTTSELLLDHLKKSLSITLTHLYPLAGRVKDVFTLHCNDGGALFVEARVVGENISSVVNHPRMETLCQLLPCNPGEWPSEVNDYAVLAVQVTTFPCGGIAVGACLWHGIADASTAATFLQTWATISRDGDDSKIGGGFVVDCSGTFAPRSVDVNQTVPWDGEAARKSKPVMKRFVFEGSKIATLREKLATLSGRNGGVIASIPTRIEALSALIWAAFIAASRERNKHIRLHLLLSAVNVRKRMIPPLPPNSIGSTLHIALAAAAGERGASVDECRRRVQESIRRVKDPLVREVYGGGEGAPESLAEAMEKGGNIEKVGAEEVVGCLVTTSWCRFPFYEADLGWGKPAWVANAAVGMNTVVFLDTPDGEGLEAWVKMREEDMFRVEQNQDFAALLSLSQTV